jgi:hypothetical protein
MTTARSIGAGILIGLGLVASAFGGFTFIGAVDRSAVLIAVLSILLGVFMILAGSRMVAEDFAKVEEAARRAEDLAWREEQRAAWAERGPRDEEQ